MKILVTGAKGQLGGQLINIISKGYSEIGQIDEAYKDAKIISSYIDISNADEVLKFVDEIKPDIIINCAAYTNVDGCEENTDLAFRANALGPRNLAIAAERVKAKLVHISTDYVFSGFSVFGDSYTSYREYDIPHPVSIYGKTKLMGENYVKNLCSRYFIVRTAWLYGYKGKNFVKTIMKAAKEKGELKVVDDQRGSPTSAEDLAHHIFKIALTNEYGIYHCTGKGQCSWYDFACEIVSLSQINCIVKPIKSDKICNLAKRPCFSSLDNMMLRSTVGDEMRNWQEALKEFISKVKLED